MYIFHYSTLLGSHIHYLCQLILLSWTYRCLLNFIPCNCFSRSLVADTLMSLIFTHPQPPQCFPYLHLYHLHLYHPVNNSDLPTNVRMSNATPLSPPFFGYSKYLFHQSFILLFTWVITNIIMYLHFTIPNNFFPFVLNY